LIEVRVSRIAFCRRRTKAPASLEAFRSAWGTRPDPPTITVAIAIGLARGEFLVEVDAAAVVAE